MFACNPRIGGVVGAETLLAPDSETLLQRNEAESDRGHLTFPSFHTGVHRRI